MARKAKKKAKTKKRAVKRATKRVSKRAAPKRKAKAKRQASGGSAMKSARRQQEPIPADPAGRIGVRRPSNEPKAPGPKEPREIAQAEPDARFDDAREPERSAREIEGGTSPAEEKDGYKNTDERF